MNRVTNTIDSLYLSDNQQKQKTERNTGDMDKDAFLRLLITQLQNQDPLNPMEDQEFIAQMAQFSALEQMTNMNSNMEKFLNNQQQSQFISHSDLIGKQVAWVNEKIAEDGSIQKENREGIVTSVKFKDGQAELIVDGGFSVSTKSVTAVSLPGE